MYSYPLRSPNGVIYAYVCGHCRKVSTGGEKWKRMHSDEDIAEIAERSQEAAERCCQCTACGKAVFSEDCEWMSVCPACWDGGMRQDHEARVAKANQKYEELLRLRTASVETHAKDKVSAYALRSKMEDISESTWAAGWLSHLECDLWEILENPEVQDVEFGMGMITQADIQELRELRDRAGGWWTYDLFIPLAAWPERYQTEQNQRQAENKALEEQLHGQQDEVQDEQ